MPTYDMRCEVCLEIEPDVRLAYSSRHSRICRCGGKQQTVPFINHVMAGKPTLWEITKNDKPKKEHRWI